MKLTGRSSLVLSLLGVVAVGAGVAALGGTATPAAHVAPAPAAARVTSKPVPLPSPEPVAPAPTSSTVAATPAVTGHPGSGTVDHTAPAPGAPRHGRQSTGRAAPIGAPTVAVPPASSARSSTSTSCRPGEEWQGGFGCVATQLPGETDGRQVG